MTDGFVLGLDGGGSKTELVVADRQGAVVAFERAVGLDPVADPEWEKVLIDLLGRVTAALPRVRSAVLALPAYSEAEAVSRHQAETVARSLGSEHKLLNDVHAAQIGAFAGGPGVLLLAGTGSMVWWQDHDGRIGRVGGWGEAFGDEGSAFWIGREALGMAARTLDGRAHHDVFTRDLLRRLNFAPGDLLPWCWSLGNRRAGIAALAAIVDEMAAAGDAEAAGLLASAANHLVSHVEAANATLSAPLPWSYAGGLFNSGTISLRVTSRLGAPAPPALPPVGGAVLHAARAAGWDIDDRWVRTLAAALAAASDRAKH